MSNKRTVFLHLVDKSDKKSSFTRICKTDKTEAEIQGIIDEIIAEYKTKGITWYFQSILDELEKKGIIKVLPIYYYEIFISEKEVK